MTKRHINLLPPAVVPRRTLYTNFLIKVFFFGGGGGEGVRSENSGEKEAEFYGRGNREGGKGEKWGKLHNIS